MGILKSGLLGPFRKKVGPVIGRSHRHQDIMTGLHEKTNKAPSEKQMESQLKFGLLNSFLSQIDKLVHPGFKSYSTKGKSALNAAYSYNYNRAFAYSEGQIIIDYPKIVYSRGHIATPENAVAVAENGLIKISWLLEPQSVYCQYTDVASFLIFNPEKKQRLIVPKAASRFSCMHQIKIPQALSGGILHCYMNFDSANGKLTGDSIYIGKVIA